MEPSCSQSSCSFYDGSNTIPFESKVEIKTENKASILETNEEEITPNNVLIKSETIDELEREDYEEENRIIKHCSETIEAGKLAKSPQFLGNLSSANSSLASSSETISTLSNPNERIFSLPGCSKGEDFEDSKAGLKNILHLNFSYSNMNSAEDAAKLEPPRAQTVVFKDDFMKTLLGTGPNTGDFEEKMYKEGKCDIIGTESNLLFDKTKGPSSRTSSNASSIGSTSSDLHKDTFTVASTSNAEKLLGLCGSTSDSLKSPALLNKQSRDPRFTEKFVWKGTKPVKSYVNYGDEEEESEDDDNEASWCTCMMTHEVVIVFLLPKCKWHWSRVKTFG